MAITQDGYGQHSDGGGLTSGTVTLSTTNGSDIIVLAVFSGDNGHGGPSAISGVSSTNTTGWTKRSSTVSTTQAGGSPAIVDMWWGQAAASLTNEVITFTFGGTVDNYAAAAAGWAGVNQTTPWDVNVSLPAGNKADSGTTDPSVSGVSTSAANTMIIAFAGTSQSVHIGQNFADPASEPSGFTGWGTPPQTNLGNLYAQGYGVRQVQTSPQSGLTVTYNQVVSTWVMVVDALQAAGQAVVTKSSAYIVGF